MARTRCGNSTVPRGVKSFELPGTDFVDAELAYDADRQRVVLYRASFGGGVETWELNGTSWEKKSPAQNPVACPDGALFKYDAGQKRCVLVGGTGADTPAETWLWDGNNWTKAAGVQPAKALTGGMAYDGARQKLILLATDMKTWVLSGADWTVLNPVHSPPYVSLGFFSLEFDPERQVCSFFGGEASVDQSMSYPTATWEWNGQDWNEFSAGPPVVTPPVLSIQRVDAQQVILSWPGEAAGFVLERATSLGGQADWQTVNVTPTGNNPFTVTLDIAGAASFFRLVKP